MAALKVLKFGGTSMGSADAMNRVIAILKQPQQDGRVAAVVVSAMSGVTNKLIEIGRRAAKRDRATEKLLEELNELHTKTLKDFGIKKTNAVEATLEQLATVVKEIQRSRELSAPALDMVMSFGERLSAQILTGALSEHGIDAEYLDARKVVHTDAHFGSAAPDFKKTNRAIAAYFKKHKKLQVATGFIGSAPSKQTTTLGRGGSDYSAAIFGAALNSRAIEIWTDVSGVFTADPRLVKEARVVPELAFEEAGELAYFGAKVLHPKTILPAMREGIPVKVLNTFKPADKGTTIVANFKERRMKSHTVEALTFKRPVTIVHVHSPEFFDANGLMASIFRIFEKHRTSIDIVATSIAAVSLTIDNERNLPEILKELKKLGEVTLERNKAIVCAVGGSINTAGVAGRMFTAMGKSGVNVEMISQASSAVSITFIVDERDAEKALKVLHREYIEQ